jgi:hypothetical protein
MRESRTYGSVRGALSNERPYRDAACLPSGCVTESCNPSLNGTAAMGQTAPCRTAARRDTTTFKAGHHCMCAPICWRCATGFTPITGSPGGRDGHIPLCALHRSVGEGIPSGLHSICGPSAEIASIESEQY